jgi:CRISPR/Cas system-associated endonuclease Cas3-HD
MEKYALGQNQTAIARDEKINQETVARIVKSAEMESYIEHVRERWRGLCDSAIEVVRQKLKEGDKEVYNRP